MRPRFANDWCTVYEADCREVAALEEPGSFSLAILDGPYGMGKAAWDRVKIDELAEWYRPHLEDVGRLCGASASLYVWNTAAGWARLDPVVRGMGWTFRALVVWDKQSPGLSALTGAATLLEVAGAYTRGNTSAACSGVWTVSTGTGLGAERIPHPSKTQSSIKDGYIWPAALHPCQKPLTFADRIIRASSRPGERIWAPFGGTLREALAATRIGRSEPEESRHVVTCELNADGVDYLGPAIAQIEGTWDAKAAAGQVGLFGSAAHDTGRR